MKIYSDTKSFSGSAALDQLPVYSLHDKGDLRRKRTGELHENYRVSLDVSDAEWNAFEDQAEDAIQFLKTHRDALSEILASSDDIEAYLDFPLWSRLSGEIVNQNDHLPRELINLAGELRLGIEMSIYAQDAFDGLNENKPTKAEQGRADQLATAEESKSE